MRYPLSKSSTSTLHSGACAPPADSPSRGSTIMPAPTLHDPQWLDEVRQPGPNGQTFHHLSVEDVLGSIAGDIMEEDTNTGEFTPGCRAYAGYGSLSSFANMGAVLAYAHSQGASAFSYTPQPDGSCNALDMEPGNAGTSSFHIQIA